MRFLRQHAYTLVFAACIAVAYAWPRHFISVGGWKLTGLVMPLVEVIMFGMGMTLKAEDFLNVLKRPAPVALGAVLQFALMPFVGLCVALLLGLEGEIATGVVLIGSVAGGVASNVIAYVAGANVALSVTMTAVSTCLAPLMTPLLMRLLAGRFVHVDAGAMALSLAEMVLLPIAASQMARWALARRFPRALRAVGRLMPYLSMAALCAMTFVSVAPAERYLREAGATLLLAAAIHNGVGYLSGYWGARFLARFLGMDESDVRTVAIEVGMQNGGMGNALAVGVLKSEAAALAPIVFGTWMNVSGALLAGYWHRRPAEARSGAQP